MMRSTWKTIFACAIREQKEIEMTEIHLDKKQREFIDEQVKAGIYKDADAVVAAGLRLLGSKEGGDAELRRLVRLGTDDIESGRIHEYGSAEEMLDDIKQMPADDVKKTGTGH
jgi:antitoxin ParD1/3/4